VDDGLREAVSATLRSVTKLGGIADLVVPGLLRNDGRIIADERGQ
jgi:phenylacetate-CoA ligase